MIVRRPDLIVGAIVSCQYGRNRATVSFKDSVSGIDQPLSTAPLSTDSLYDESEHSDESL